MERTPVAAHQALVRTLLSTLAQREAERIPLERALGRVLAEPVAAPIDLPPFRNSQMDGYAVHSADLAGGVRELPIVGEIAAEPGVPQPLPHGRTVRIMTGAPLPDGADAVVPVEEVVEAAETARFAAQPEPGAFVRLAGSDAAAGETILDGGRCLTSRGLAALAAAGVTTVPVFSPVRVAVVSTGSELAAPGSTLRPGQIFDANGAALAAAVHENGADLVHRALVSDDAAAFARELDTAIDRRAEVIVTSGGVSQGRHEVVRDTLGPLGAHIDVLALQPGGPQATAVYRGVPVVCLPGNPVSAQVSFLLFVEPILREVAALPPRMRTARPLHSALTSVPGRRQLQRGRVLPDGSVAPSGGTSSHLVVALATADVLIDVPVDAVALDAGTVVETWDL